MDNKTCLHCGKLFNKKSHESKKYWETKKYCSRECSAIAQIGISIPKGPMSEETKRKLSIAKKGRFSGDKHPNWKPKTIKECPVCGKTMMLAPWEKNRICCSVKCGCKLRDRGKTKTSERVRKSKAYKDWRTSVFERDDYTCQECGIKGGTLNAHHIKHFSEDKDSRLDINNGLTLCVKCHKLKHSKKS